MKRTLSVNQVLQVRNDTLPLTGGWRECFGEIDRTGILFVYGPSTSGKSSAALCLAKELAQFGRVLYLSNEEGFRTSFQERLRRFTATDCGARIQFVCHETVGELIERLGKRRSADFVVIDSVQDSKILRSEYENLKRLSARKMFIFISRVEGRQPVGRLARQIKFDADLKVWVEGGRVISEGRYIGPVGHFDVLEEKAREYWSSNLHTSDDDE
ncbi:AAA family ATPase [uncultured Alistipes sp.]|uniref:AAA family ATPase n=1 Tax=uncultured Alistipes sp. TaxID=538949 RepID=UPI0025F6E4D8|nr:AAA family ATPase [uncultured Alistipes sp.]